jgi:hypothetical protein
VTISILTEEEEKKKTKDFPMQHFSQNSLQASQEIWD